MGKFIKYLLVTVVAIVLLLGITIGAIITMVNPNSFKPTISKQFQAATGRRLMINGNISWAFFPSLSLQVHNITIDNPAGFETSTFAHLNEADIRIRLLPLFEGKYEMGKLIIKDLRLNLIKNKQGLANWEFFNNKKSSLNPAKLTSSKPQQTTKKPETLSNKPIDLSVHALALENANISYVDQQKNQKISIRHLNVNSRDIALNRAFPISASFSFSESQNHANGRFEMNANVNYDPNKGTLNLTPIDLKTQLRADQLKQHLLKLSTNIYILINLKTQSFDASSLSADIDNVNISGSAKGNHLTKQPNLSGKLTIAEFNPKALLTDLGQTIKTQDPNALTHARASFKFQTTANTADVNDLNLTLDESHLTGNLAVALNPETLNRFNLNLDKINLNQYLPKQPEAQHPNAADASSQSTTNTQSATPSATAARTEASSPELPINTLRKLMLLGKMHIGELIIHKAKLTDIQLGASANKGLLALNPIKANLYQGNADMGVFLNVRGPQAKMVINEKINHVQAQPLVSSFINSKRFSVTGAANSSGSVQAIGNKVKQWITTLAGSIKFAFTNGVLKGVDIKHQLQVANALFKREPSPQTSGSDETPFGDLTGTLTFANGTASNNDLLLKSPLLEVTGQGHVNMVSKKIDYKLDAKAINSGFGELNKLQSILGGSIPLQVSGTIDNPRIYPNPTAITKAITKQYVEKESGEVKKQVNNQLQKLGNKLQDSLKGFLN